MKARISRKFWICAAVAGIAALIEAITRSPAAAAVACVAGMAAGGFLAEYKGRL